MPVIGEVQTSEEAPAQNAQDAACSCFGADALDSRAFPAPLLNFDQVTIFICLTSHVHTLSHLLSSLSLGCDDENNC